MGEGRRLSRLSKVGCKVVIPAETHDEIFGAGPGSILDWLGKGLGGDSTTS